MKSKVYKHSNVRSYKFVCLVCYESVLRYKKCRLKTVPWYDTLVGHFCGLFKTSLPLGPLLVLVNRLFLRFGLAAVYLS